MVLAADPLKVNKLVPSVAPLFNLTIKLELTLFALVAAPPTSEEAAYFVLDGNALTSEAVNSTVPVCPLTLKTVSVGVSNSFQFANVEAGVVCKTYDLFKSLLMAISPF